MFSRWSCFIYKHSYNACEPTVCNRTWFGDVGKTYEMELDKPTALPFVCHLNFTAAGGSHGDIIQVRKMYLTLTGKSQKKASLIKLESFFHFLSISVGIFVFVSQTL